MPTDREHYAAAVAAEHANQRPAASIIDQLQSVAAQLRDAAQHLTADERSEVDRTALRVAFLAQHPDGTTCTDPDCPACADQGAAL